MCRCTPNLRTPFCGKPGCEMPAPSLKAAAEERLRKASIALYEANRRLDESEREHAMALNALEDIEMRAHPHDR
jgi:hypothetical protein